MAEIIVREIVDGVKKPNKVVYDHFNRLPLWSSGQGIWLQIQRSWVRFPALPDFSEWQWVWNGVHSAS